MSSASDDEYNLDVNMDKDGNGNLVLANVIRNITMENYALQTRITQMEVEKNQLEEEKKQLSEKLAKIEEELDEEEFKMKVTNMILKEHLEEGAAH
ncbi:hypothetical protein R1flu_018351 [Riccia fluitans]|uniref:Uncharacterized protein n=1 Tax=Riccia fluitans TaxID=41844 RepID=A0ABD1ZFS1_9MARC